MGGDDEIEVQRGADRVRVASGRGWVAGGRCLPADGSVGGDALSLEEEIRAARGERDARGAPVARRECAAQTLGGGSDAGQAHPVGGYPKKV